MIRKIELHNFMAHAHTVLEPAPDGLTMLTGPNNCGKSAVVVALQTVCTNISGDFMVRHGAKDCRIVVTTDEGHTLQWRRKGKTVSYSVNDREVHRLKGDIPGDLHDHLRLDMVKDLEGNDAFDIHFAQQKKPIFLLDQSGKQAATFFASSSDAALLMEMQNEHRRATADARRDERRLSGEVEHLSKMLESLAPVTAAAEAMKAAEAQDETLRLAESSISSLDEHLQRSSRWRREVIRAERAAEALAPLPTPPTLGDTASLQGAMLKLNQAGQLLARCRQQAAILAPTPSPPFIPDPAPLAGLCESMNRSGRRLAMARRRRTACESLTPPPPISDPQPLSQVIHDMIRREGEVKRFGSVAASLKTVSEAPSLADPAPLAAQIAALEAAQKAVGRNERALASAERDRQAAADAIRDWVTHHPQCPTCGAEIDADRVLATAGRLHDHA